MKPRIQTLLEAFCLAYTLLPPTTTAYTLLSDSSLHLLPSPGTGFDIHTGALLSPILIPRVPGTDNSTKVLQHFTDFFAHNLPSWSVTYQNSTSTTPTSGDAQIPFRNFIATRDPPWASPGDVSYLTLAAHYDSLSIPEGFIGAIDSAAPCAMLMHVAQALDAALTRKWEHMQSSDLATYDGIEEQRGIQILLLDGEEAFLSWSDTDSTYGARSLASTWENEYHAAGSTFKNKLESISLFVLLDLLGAPSPTIPSYFKTTHWAYVAMATLEQRLRNLSPPGLWKSSSQQSFLPEAAKSTTRDRFLSTVMQDDHVPFIDRGVDVLHLIPIPFPSVWHNTGGVDDGEALDGGAVQDWAVLVSAFAAEWLELEGFFEGGDVRGSVDIENSGSGTEMKRRRGEVISKTEL